MTRRIKEQITKENIFEVCGGILFFIAMLFYIFIAFAAPDPFYG